MSITKIPSSNRFRQLATSVAVALTCLAANTLAQTNNGPKILFLHLQLKDGSVSLIKSSVRPGYLKPRPNQDLPDGLHLELSDDESHACWRGVVENPCSRLIEYEDPPGSGKLKRKKVDLPEPEFMVRVPVLAEARQIEFYTLEPTKAGNRAQRRSLGKLQLPAR